VEAVCGNGSVVCVGGLIVGEWWGSCCVGSVYGVFVRVTVVWIVWDCEAENVSIGAKVSNTSL